MDASLSELAMTNTDIRVQLAKKLGWTHTQIVQGEPVGLSPSRHNIHILPSLYDLCQQGEERLTEEQQRKYIITLVVAATEQMDPDHKLGDTEEEANAILIWHAARLSNLPERARAMIETLP